MRTKEEKLIITFPTTLSAMEMERVAKEQGAPGRLIPVPTAITASCGLAWMAKPEESETLQELLSEFNLQHEAVYCLML